jgi:predicted peroxiredoxin
MAKNVINRAMYKEIKHYNKEQMEKFLQNIYFEGMKEVYRQLSDLKLFREDEFRELLEIGIKEEKGIGVKTKQKIDKIINNIFKTLKSDIKIKIE